MVQPNSSTNVELLDAIGVDRAALDAIVGALSESQLVARDADGWSVSDHLSHIAAWERMIVAHLRDRSAHVVAGMDDEASYAAATLDHLNERLHQRFRDRGLAETLREFADAHRAIVMFIAEMPEQRLSECYWDDDPDRRTVLDKIAGDTYLHYREHGAWIRAIIERRAADART